jgi:hypothetical protein
VRAGGSAQFLSAFTRETTREMGRNNSLAVTLVLSLLAFLVQKYKY